MAKTGSPPERIYKYRGFSHRVLDMLVMDDLYFADPSSFNDPLDTTPNLEADLPVEDLERVLTRLVVERTRAEMTKAAKSIRYTGPRTIEHIDRHSQARADRLLDEVRYRSCDPYYQDVPDALQFLLGSEIETEVLKRYDRGIVSFATRATCPLMWSHYGDQHRGICAGYSVPEGTAADLFPVAYGGRRNVKASDVDAMETDVLARRRVDEAALFRKAPSWRYEKEWRLVGNRGSQDSPLELEEVIFGMRCPGTVKYTIVKALHNRRRQVQFYEVPRPFGTFRLTKRRLDTDELLTQLPRRHLDAQEMFEDLDLAALESRTPPAT
ncbi:DUF2971 domain-containing protein [Georhizobium profundi]|nr:DUF2971 domain-containing protein [Georhizobium profundi]